MNTVQTDGWINATREEIRERFGWAKEALREYAGPPLPNAESDLREAERRCLEMARMLHTQPTFREDFPGVGQQRAIMLEAVADRLGACKVDYPKREPSSSPAHARYKLGCLLFECSRVARNIVCWFELPEPAEINDAKVDASIEKPQPIPIPGKAGRPTDYEEAYSLVKKLRPATPWKDIYEQCQVSDLEVPDEFETFKRTMNRRLDRDRDKNGT